MLPSPKRTSAAAFLLLLFSAFAGTPEKLRVYRNIPLWPGGSVPGAVGNLPIDNPYLTAVLPEGHGNGTAVIICPGGGNVDLFAHQEGIDVAEKLGSWGVAAFVLTYRLSPRYPQQDTRTMDGRRAIRLLRARAAEFGIDPKKIGIMGFSAGGNLIRPVASEPAPGDAQAADPVDRVSSHPDFAIQVYGPGRPTPGESLKDYPPVFLTAAAGDAANAPGMAQFFIDLKKAGVNAELHLYQQGRHGYGLAEGHPVLSDWVGRCEVWMTNIGLLGPVPGAAPVKEPALVSQRVLGTVNDGYGDHVLVPAGAFRMGDGFNEGDVRERPVHVVELDAYYIGKYPVTNVEFRKFRDDSGYDDAKFWPTGSAVPKDQSAALTRSLAAQGRDNYPVAGVTWEQAVAYCNWLSARTGKTYRLPTEAEWEKAARGTDQRRYPWGNDLDPGYASYKEKPLTFVGFYDGSRRGELQTHNNGSPYGAFDMEGGVFEWCSDWYSPNY
jgi:acetyl esterase/lipase